MGARNADLVEQQLLVRMLFVYWCFFFFLTFCPGDKRLVSSCVVEVGACFVCHRLGFGGRLMVACC